VGGTNWIKFLFLWHFDQFPFMASNYDASRSHLWEDCSVKVISPMQYLCLTTHNSHNTQTSMAVRGFKPASEWLQIHALDCVATTVSSSVNYITNCFSISL
jgi:hypothetical protein